MIDGCSFWDVSNDGRCASGSCNVTDYLEGLPSDPNNTCIHKNEVNCKVFDSGALICTTCDDNFGKILTDSDP